MGLKLRGMLEDFIVRTLEASICAGELRSSNVLDQDCSTRALLSTMYTRNVKSGTPASGGPIRRLLPAGLYLLATVRLPLSEWIWGQSGLMVNRSEYT